MPHPTSIDTAAHQHARHDSQHSDTGSSSPVAPAYSPITPKVQPALPAIGPTAFIPPDDGADFTFSVGNPASHPPPAEREPRPVAPPTQYIPQPPNLPFSGDDSTDAIALRAAISTLQFQKKKAQEDIRALEKVKQLALDDPDHFRSELAAGRMSERRPRLGDVQAILDHDDETDEEDEDEEMSVKLGAEQDLRTESPEIPDSQDSSQSTSRTADAATMDVDAPKPFPPLPGPQSVVRMPYVNWDKYGIVGEPLESIHAQQQRWPGTNPPGPDGRREHTIAAPYSPWLDSLSTPPEHAAEHRKDSAAIPPLTPFVSVTGTISEHPMETRSRH